MAARRFVPGLAAVLVLAMLVWAWILGGEQELQEIRVPVTLPNDGAENGR